jgi:TolA-binding protein
MKAKTILAVLLFAVSATGMPAQSSTGTAPAKVAKAKHKTDEQVTIEQMDVRIQKLEQLVQEMRQQLADNQKQIDGNKKQAISAQNLAEKAGTQERLRAENTLEKVAKDTNDIQALQGSVAGVEATNSTLTQMLVAEQADTYQIKNTSALHFMGIDLKPGGFLAGETVNRQRAIGGDINTQFSGIPFSGQTAADFSEFNGGGRQSRVTLLAEGKLSNAALHGYYEADFLSAGTTSNDNQSNSYGLRQRQVWAQAELDSGWTFTGGQMWSLATEYRSGLANNREATPLTIDAQYNVGFTWERQYGFRVAKSIGDKFWAAASIEEPQTLNIGGHNLPADVFQQAGNSGGLYNPTANYSYNYAPDLIAKVAYEPGFGHFELFAIGSFFRARVFPNAISLNGGTASSTPALGAYTAKTQGGGLGLNARAPVWNKRIDVGMHILAGDGIGRYSTTTLPDATEHADGSLELLTGGSALASVEWHTTPKLDLYSYYGGEYVKRAYYNTGLIFATGAQTGLPVLTGYGAPTNNLSGCHVEVAPVTSANGGGYVPGTAVNCAADTRNIQEGTLGFWYRFYRGPKGSLQTGLQYSYVVRHTWLGIGDPLSPLGSSPTAIDNMWFTSFRYYLPQ